MSNIHLFLMSFTYNIFSLVLIICVIITIIIANTIYRRGGKAIQWFSLMMIANSIWSAGYALELASSSLQQIKFFINLQYLGITTLPLAWLFFCLHFCGKDYWYKKPLNIILLLIIPLTTVFLVWTNNLHHLHYKSISLDTSGPFPMASLETGIWYKLFAIYFYCLLIAGCFLILSKFKTSDQIYKKQNYTIIFATSIPWIANFAYMNGIRPLGHVDVTPFAFIVSSIIILIGIYRFKLFDIIPLAREKVLELMQDGFLVLDQKNRVIDFNKSIKNYIDHEEKKLIGTEIKYLFPNHKDFLHRIKNHIAGKIELEVEIEHNLKYLEADILFLYDNKINNDFSIIKLQDLTAIKKDAIKTKEQAKELERLNELKDRIFSIIAHDLRGPLVNLSEVLKMYNNDQITSEEFKAISPTLSKNISYTTDLLENILHWSRSQLKGISINKEFFNLRELILKEIAYHLPAATNKKIKLTNEIMHEATVYADILMIQIVTKNIISNAIKFCKENCEVKLSATEQSDGEIILCIADDGVGIKKEIMDKLFNEENISTRGTLNEKGTGLGLLICKEFMTKNNGSLKVNSIEGEGAKFYLKIPTKII